MWFQDSWHYTLCYGVCCYKAVHPSSWQLCCREADAIKTSRKGALDGAFLNGIGHSIAGVRRILSNNKAGIKKFYVDETGSVKIDGVGGSKADITTEIGYNAGDTQVRVDGDWTENDMKQALLGHPPRGRCWNMQKYSYYVFT